MEIRSQIAKQVWQNISGLDRLSSILLMRYTEHKAHRSYDQFTVPEIEPSSVVVLLY